MIFRIVKRIYNISLLNKFMLIIIMVIFSLYLIFMFSVSFLVGKYNQILCSEKASLIRFAASAVESRLSDIDKISKDILVNTNIQKNLDDLSNNYENIRVPVVKRELYNELLNYLFASQYIKAIEIVSNNREIISTSLTGEVGIYNKYLLNDLKNVNGSTLCYTLNENKIVLNARQVRKMKYMTLEHIGNIYIFIDIDSVFKDSFKEIDYVIDKSNLIVFNKGERIFPINSEYTDEQVSLIITGLYNKNYDIRTLNNNKKLIIKVKMKSEDWHYIYLMNYDDLFYDISKVKISVLIAVSLCGIITFAITTSLIPNICRHLITLIEKIKKFSLEEEIETSQYYKERNDEIGKLHQAFGDMSNNIINLRNENYKKQILLKDTQLKMLQQQINPHFLYNTLDMANWLAISSGMEDISVLISSLGSLLRNSISNNKDIILLSEELDILNDYINIQKIRFKDRFVCNIMIPENMYKLPVPKLCIQPLVENAVKYSLEYDEDICSIYIEAGEKEDIYYIKVSNTGSEFSDEIIDKINKNEQIGNGMSIGLDNIDKRLKILYGTQFGIKIFNKDNMATVIITVPRS